MQTDGARQTFPCFDEPSFKAQFVIKLLSRVDLGYITSLSSMPEAEKQVIWFINLAHYTK